MFVDVAVAITEKGPDSVLPAGIGAVFGAVK
jgi:hypothetical protein